LVCASDARGNDCACCMIVDFRERYAACLAEREKRAAAARIGKRCVHAVRVKHEQEINVFQPPTSPSRLKKHVFTPAAVALLVRSDAQSTGLRQAADVTGRDEIRVPGAAAAYRTCKSCATEFVLAGSRQHCGRCEIERLQRVQVGLCREVALACDRWLRARGLIFALRDRSATPPVGASA
jgi:hypothetical protein